MGEVPQGLPVMVASRSATETVDECILIQNRYWKSLPSTIRRDEAEAEGKVIGLAGESPVIVCQPFVLIYRRHALQRF